MIDPPRLFQETESHLERALLEAGSAYRSSSETRAKTLAALGIGGALSLSAGTAAGASLAPAAKIGWLKLVAFSLSAVGAVSSVPLGFYAWEKAHVVTSAPAVVAVVAPGPATPVAARPAEVAPVVARESTPLPQPTRADVRSPATPPLAAEVVALDAARSALANGDARGSLSLLDEYARAYPHGRLEIEGEALRIDALAKSGQKAAAKKHAESFLRRHPKSVLGARVRAYLDDEPAEIPDGRLSAAMRSVLAGLCALPALLVACDTTVDSLGYDRSGLADAGPPVDAGPPDAGPPVDAGPPFLRPLIGPSAYPNAFRDVLGKTDTEIANKIAATFNQLFHGDPGNQAIYFPVGDNKAYIQDVLHGDIRTEGIGYAMIICVELNKRDEFDRLWTYTKTTARYASGANQGYFASSCDTPTGATPCVDPFGLEHFAMALVFAHDRWQVGAADGGAMVDDGAVGPPPRDDGGTSDAAATSDSAATSDAAASDSGVPAPSEAAAPAPSEAAAPTSTIDYGADALGLFDLMRHKQAQNGGIVDGVTNTFDDATHLVFDVPNVSASTYTRPSIEMPAFYDLWAQATGDMFFADAATSARAYWKRATNPTTGLMPARAYFADGSPVDGSENFNPEAYRTLLNIALDRIWFAREPWEVDEANRLLAFFSARGLDTYGTSYSIDGTNVTAAHEPALVIMNGTIALIATPNMNNRTAFIEAVWNMTTPTGPVRYYQGIVDLLSLIILSGQYRVY